MANISDDERLEVDIILEQRKRKGLLEYLVRWKGSSDVRDETWEPVSKLAVEYAQAIQAFTKRLKSKKTKRSTSRSRKTSRSRSRSSSRSRKAAPGKEKARSRSRGRKKVDVEKIEISEGESSRATRSSTTKGNITNTAEVIKLASELAQVSNSTESHTHPKTESLEVASSNMKSWQQLEVQRVHNEQCLVRDDDLKPRSAIWKVADYAVIALFILSLIAALFLFLEKFIDLEEFKKQAFPNMSVLQDRLDSIQNNLFEVAYSVFDRLYDVWLYLFQQTNGADVKDTSKS